MSEYARELNIEELELNIDEPDLSQIDRDNKAWALIGQDRAIKALEMGLSIRAKGYNIFVLGESGVGKHTAIMDILSRHRGKNGSLRDIAYVQNFKEPDKPKHLILQEGLAVKFKEDISLLIERLKQRIVRELETETYKAKRDNMVAKKESNESRMLSDFEKQLDAKGFKTIQTENLFDVQTTDIAAVINGKITHFDELQELLASGKISEDFWADTRDQYYVFMSLKSSINRELRAAREALSQSLENLRRETIRPVIEELCKLATAQWPQESTATFLKTLEEDVLENADALVCDDDDEKHKDLDWPVHYGVNVVLDRSGIEKRPVIHETNPSKTNLFGSVEANYDLSGELRTNMMMIKAGSLLKADGGFLILQADDIFSRDGLWPELKRALQTGHVVPEIQSTPLGPLPILMKPEPVSTKTTVILVGSSSIYESVCSQDEEFLKLFKVTAEFSSVMPKENKTEREYASFAQNLVASENFRPITPDGIKKIISYGVRLAEKRNRLSTKFSLIGDLIREAEYAAEQGGCKVIDGRIIQKSIASREYLGNLPEEILLEQIQEGSLIIEVDGSKAGIVNGLAVLERGNYAFGTALRITATISPGKEGLINIERESGLSGDLHDKGMYLLEGYLRYRFGRRQNIALSGSIAIEQSYFEIDGDSASAAELAALLSAISGIPLRQDIAVTGAINQQGIIQSVSGLYEKVQGFFNACRIRGLTGRQGVVVPASNINSVILPDNVIDAVREGSFHVWIAQDIDQLMALLTGLKAGKQRRKDRFEAYSINERIRCSLTNLSNLS